MIAEDVVLRQIEGDTRDVPTKVISYNGTVINPDWVRLN